MDSSRPKTTNKDAHQLQQLQRHKLHLLDQHRRHLIARSQLETQLADLRTLLQIREKEIDLAKSGDISEIRELEGNISLLEEENKRLRVNIAANSEIERLKVELNQALEQKKTYEEQLKEAIYRSLVMEQEDTDMTPMDESQEELGELEIASAALAQVKAERNQLISQVIPALEQSIRAHESEKIELERRLDLVRSAHTCDKTGESLTPRPKTTMKTQADYDRKKVNLGIRPKSSLSPKQQSLLVTHGKLVVRNVGLKKSLGPKPPVSPSFYRGNRPVTTSKPKQTQVKDDSFADEFPEEDELL